MLNSDAFYLLSNKKKQVMVSVFFSNSVHHLFLLSLFIEMMVHEFCGNFEIPNRARNSLTPAAKIVRRQQKMLLLGKQRMCQRYDGICS